MTYTDLRRHTCTKDDTAPERIGLKRSEGYEHNYYSVVTHHFDEEGVEYVRADLFDALEAERDRLREALEQYAGATDAWGIKYEPIDDKGAVARAALRETDT